LAETATLAPADVIGHCDVSSQRPKFATRPGRPTTSPTKDLAWQYEDEGSQSDSADSDPDSFFCGLGLDAARGLFYKFCWAKHREAAMQDSPTGGGTAWNVQVDGGGAMKNKGKQRECQAEEDSGTEESSDDGTEEDFFQDNEEDNEELDAHDEEATAEDLSEPEHLGKDEAVVSSLSKKRGRPRKGGSSSNPTTPRKRRKLAVPTPHSKAALRARRQKGKGKSTAKRHNFTICPPRATTDYAQLRNLPPDPLLRAMHVLHVGARPDALPCREDEYVEVMGAILGLVEEGSGGCVCE